MKTLISTLLACIILPFSSLHAQAPVSMGSNLNPFDLEYWNFDVVMHNGKVYYLALTGNGDDVEWFVYNPANNTNTQISNHFHGSSNGTVVTNRMIIGNNMFFTGYANPYEAEFYRIDLTTDQLYMIEINTGGCLAQGTPAGSTPGNFTEGPGGRIYFTATSTNNGTQVFLWDPATPNTVTKLTTYNPNAGLAMNHGDGFILHNNKILMSGHSNAVNSGSQQWCDNTRTQYYIDNKEILVMDLSDNSITLHDLNTGTYPSGALTYNNSGDPQSFFNINGQVYFQSRTGNTHLASYQLCRIDLNAGTPAVTILSNFTNVQSSGAIGNYIYDGNDRLYFRVTTYANGNYVSEELHRLTISTGQITKLTNYNSMDHYPNMVGMHNGHIFFLEYDSESALYYIKKLNMSNNSISFASNQGFAAGWMLDVKQYGSKLYFNGDLIDGAGEELLSFDLTGNTIARIGDIAGGGTGSYPMMMQSSGSDLVFMAAEDGANYSLFKLANAISSLPVKLVAFKVSLVDKKAVLNWKTAEEVNNKGFEVLRSTDGAQFGKIGWVAARTEPGSYRFEENLQAKGTYYYQLRQVDIDGKASLSPVQKLSFDEKTLFAAVKLPEQINLLSPVKAAYQVVDMQGRVVSKGNIAIGQNIITTQRLVTGIYQLQVIDQQGKRLYSDRFSK